MTAPYTLLRAWQIAAKKQLGQNFLTDPSTAEMIVQRAGFQIGDIVLEIGAGLGALTIPAARRVRHVTAVELDRRLIQLLSAELSAAGIVNADINHANILDLDLRALAAEAGRPLVVIGNLPYQISSQVLVQLVRNRSAIARAVLMFQKEMAQRLMATPGVKDYGRLAVMLGYCAKVERIADVSAKMFYPRPKVDSRVVTIGFRPPRAVPVGGEDFFFDVVKAAFSTRRKMLKNAMAGSFLGLERATITRALSEAGVDPSRRAETLSIEEFVRLSDAVYKRMTRA